MVLKPLKLDGIGAAVPGLGDDWALFPVPSAATAAAKCLYTQ